MPLMIETAATVVAAIGRKTLVQAPISGPFTLAAELVGLENLIFAMFDHPDKVKALLQTCLQTAQTYGQALLRTGAQIAIFDSRASCNVISPDLFREFVLPLHRALVASLRRDGATFISLIIGGNTVPVADALFSVSPDLVVADFTVAPDVFLKLAETHRTLVRVNVNPILFETEANGVAGILTASAALHGRMRCVLGSGIIPYATPPRHILAARDALQNETTSIRSKEL
jgi:uroporphyrinogen-III decarboxylase